MDHRTNAWKKLLLLLVLWSSMLFCARLVVCWPGWVACAWCAYKSHDYPPFSDRAYLSADDAGKAMYLHANFYHANADKWPPSEWPGDSVLQHLLQKAGVEQWNPGLLKMEALSAAVFVALSALLVATVLGAHIQFGRPSYWRDLRDRKSAIPVVVAALNRSLEQSLTFIALALPIYATAGGLALFVAWLVLWRIGIRPESLPSSDWTFVGMYAGMLAVLSLIAGRAFREAIAGSLGPEDYRCRTCNYALRGLSNSQCPECGSPFRVVAEPIAVRRSRRWYVCWIGVGLGCQMISVWLCSSLGFWSWVEGVVKRAFGGY
jgi:hypothetical protein